MNARPRRAFARGLPGGVIAVLLAASCVHAAAPAPEIAAPEAAPLARRDARDLAWDEALAVLAGGAVAKAARLFGAFADAFPGDPRVPIARIHQAYVALGDPDPVRGLEQAEALLSRIPPGGAPERVLAPLRAAVAARRQRASRASAAEAALADCQRRLGPAADLERDRAAARALAAKLQQELLRKQASLEEVKRHLLEIQQLAAEMLGLPKPAPSPAPPRARPRQ